MTCSPLSSREVPAARRLLLGTALVVAFTASACSSATSEDTAAAASALVEQGITQMNAGENDQAEKSFEQALRLDDEQYLAHYNQGVIDQLAHRDEDAVEHYESALALESEHAASLYNLAILTESDDLERAVELYREAIASQPENAAAHMRLGFALNHLGRTSEAEPMLARGLELDPSMSTVEAPTYE